MITERIFGTTSDGHPVKAFTLKTCNTEVMVLEYGCIIQCIKVAMATGEVRDILLGFDTLAEYEADTSGQGAFIGQYANRIEGATFNIGEKAYNLEKNDGNNHLHGVYGKKMYTGSIEDGRVILRAESPDGEDGFPANVSLTVTYALAHDGALTIGYTATADADTIINLTNHSYFNLDGEGSGNIYSQSLWLNCKTFTEGNAETCPTGVILQAAGTPMDFTATKPIGQDINADYTQLTQASGYDHNFIIDKPAGGMELCAMAKSTDGKIIMETYTTQPGVQLYTANFLNTTGKGGAKYEKHNAFCLETQHYPCTPSHPQFPTVLLKKGEEMHETTIYKVYEVK